MSDKVLSSEGFGEKLYNKFPVKYREDDINQNYALMKYLKSLGDSGFKITIEDINGLLELCNPEVIPDNILPTALRHYGLGVDILEEIPPQYLRRLLCGLGTALISRGTSATIQYVLYTILSDTDMETVNVSSSNSRSISIESDITNGSVIKLPQISRGVQEVIKKFVPFFQTFYYNLLDKITLEHSLAVANVWSDVITSDIDSVFFDGSHYVNLGIFPTSDWEISVEFEATIKSTLMWLFGSRTSSNTSANSYACGIAFATSSIYPQFERFRSSVAYSSLTSNEKHRFILSKYGCYLDDGICVKSEYTDSKDFVGTFPLYVGVLNSSNDIDIRYFTGKIYSIRVNDGNSVISYSPHIQNGVTGFRDTNSNFYPLQSI